jgi:adenylate cyclase
MRNRLDRINGFLLRAAASADLAGLFGGLCEELVALGLPLWRASAAYQTLNPVVRARSDIWHRDGELARHKATHGEGESQYLRSPIRYLRDEKRLFGRWRLERGEGGSFPLLTELRDGGATDYVLHIVAFDAGTPALPGVALSFASDRPGGFGDADLADIAAVVPALGLACGRSALAEMAGSVLAIYLGASTARHVLAGEIRRGLGRRIEAAILLADLRGFTQLVDGADPLAVVGWLDGHLEAMAEAVAEHDGEVLKFLGDGLLAVFPVEEPGGAEIEACEAALLAARAAQSRNAALNAARRKDGAPVLDVDIALHYGEVIYGNVGSQQRLDFTVIGRAVNEASRIEALCAALDRPLLLSIDFARRCGRPTLSLGLHRLRGVESPREICALRDPA